MASRHKTGRKGAVGIAALAAAALFAGSAGTASSTSQASSGRIAGTDRFGTARAVALDTFTQSDTAYVASGRAFPDALSASALAGSTIGPLLLVEPNGVPAATSEALSALEVKNVVILGGTAAVSAGVADTLDDTYAVTRVAGTTRYSTSAAIARAVSAQNGGIGAFESRRTVIVANGEVFADALTAGPVANNATLPVLLTRAGDLPAETDEALTQVGAESAIIVGGTAAVSDAVAAAISAKGITVTRLAGTTRQSTAVAIADFAVDLLGFDGAHADIARGDQFPDALAGGPHGGQQNSPILLTAGEQLGADAAGWLTRRCSTVDSIDALGGTAAVSDATLAAAQQAARSC